MTAKVSSSATAGSAQTGKVKITTSDSSHALALIDFSVTAHGGTLVLTPDMADFGFAQNNHAAENVPLSLSNVGNGNLTVTVGAPSHPYGVFTIVSPTAPVSVSAGASATLITTGFTPTSTANAATATSQLTVSGAVCGESATSFALSGQGSVGVITQSLGAINFPASPCGGSAPAPRTFTMRNAGAAAATITGATFTVVGANLTASYTTNAVGLVIPASPDGGTTNGTVTVTVNAPAIPFPSPVPGAYGATLHITTNATGDTCTTSVSPRRRRELSSRGLRRILSLAAFQAFGQVPVSQPLLHHINVTNTGSSQAATVTLTTTPGTLFVVGSGASTISSSPASPGLDSVTFAPATFGAAAATLSMSTTSVICQALPADLPLAGTGMEGGLLVDKTAISFNDACGGYVAQADGEDPHSFTITNNGNVALAWVAALVDGTKFSLTPASGDLAIGATVVVAVSAAALPALETPDATYTDTIVVGGTDTNGTTLPPAPAIHLTQSPKGDILSVSTDVGAGTVPVPATVSFGSHAIQAEGVDIDSGTQTFTIANDASANSDPANVNLTMDGAGASYFVFDNGSQAKTVAVPAGTSQTFTVTFAPGTTQADMGAHPATLKFDVPNGEPICTQLPGSVALTGTSTVAIPVLSRDDFNFTPQNCGTTTPPRTMTVANTGNQDLTITGINVPPAADGVTYYTVTADKTTINGGGLDVATITVTPHQVPQTLPQVMLGIMPVAFNTFMTITTDAALKGTAHPMVQLKMGARGVVIDPAHPLLSTTWAFGTVAQGATGVYGLGIWNLGNAPAVMTMPLNNISDTLFGISAVDGSGNPVAGTVTVAAGDGFFSAGTSIAGTFTPIDQQGSWTDTGTLTIVPGPNEVFCEPLPASWASPAISLSGSASSSPVIQLNATSLVFPPTNCDATAPAGKSVTITNIGNTDQTFNASLLQATLGTSQYTLTSSTGSASGTIAANGGTVAITVTPKWPLTGASFPGTGTAPYGDTLELIFDTSSYVVPISMTVTGAVLSANLQGGNQPHATANNGPNITVSNNGSPAATVSVAFSGGQASNFSASPVPGTLGGTGTTSRSIEIHYSHLGRCSVGTSVTFTVPHLCNVAPAGISVTGDGSQGGSNFTTCN